MLEPISYKIYLDKIKQHLLRVVCTIQKPNKEGQVVSIPVWVPGSYMVREFSKHIVAINAQSGNSIVPMQKVNKNTWVCAPCDGPLIIEYLAYCFDPAARGAYIDSTRAFFDGCRVFLVVEGEEEQTRTVEFFKPDCAQQKKWRVATSLTAQNVDDAGFGKYIANNHLELIDHPVEIGDFKLLEFDVAGLLHKIVVTGLANADYERLVADVTKICRAHIDFFGELPSMEQYVFLLSIVAKGGGGIEHRASSSLLCNRQSLPKLGDNTNTKTDDYKALLGLFSHEYFHLWNVKRIKPEVFVNPNLNSEVYTRQLWIFEGITAYYDNLNMVRAEVITPKEYLSILEDDINQLLQTPGANRQTLEESSFDAWIKYYQPDENSVNATVSYYLKGALVALMLDLLIIKNSKAKQSLADVMQVLWQQYGKTGIGLPEGHFEHVVYEVTGEDYSEFFDNTLRTTKPLELAQTLAIVGVQYTAKAPSILDNLGFKITSDQNRAVVRAVLNDTVAEFAGLAPNDLITAINNITVTANNIEAIINSYLQDDSIKLYVCRNDTLLELTMLNTPNRKTLCALEYIADVDALIERNRKKWLGI